MAPPMRPAYQHKGPGPKPRASSLESSNFVGIDGNFILYRSMKLPFQMGQVLLVRRQRLGNNPARNVKFLGNLQGAPSEWATALSAATERAKAAELILSLFTRYDQLHFERLGGLDSNHCLHLFNHFRPKSKKMINKWETYNPIALHRTYERLHKQTQQFVTPDQLAHMSFEGLFDALHESELAPPAMLTSSESCGVEGGQGNLFSGRSADGTARALLLVTRRWISTAVCAVGERVVSRYNDGREWFTGEIVAVRSGGHGKVEDDEDDDDDLDNDGGNGNNGNSTADDGDIVYDVQYDDGDFEEDVPSERVLSISGNERGHWEYLVVGPEEASVSLPNDQQHPWWPNAEQFVDFVVVEATATQVAAEVATLRETAVQRYGKKEMADDMPWPLDSTGRMPTTGVGQGPRQQAEGEEKALTAEAHSAKVVADLMLPEHRSELVYMFRKLATLFLTVIDTDLRYAHLRPHQLDHARLEGPALNEVEDLWICAPVAEIAEGTRQKCDVCETSILDRHWACTVAGCEWEVCLQCHRSGERRRAARRERYERLQRGETAFTRPSKDPTWNSAVARRERAVTHTALARPYEHTSWASKRNDYTGDEETLQAKIDLVFPAIVNAAGEKWHEFVAVLPKEGKYAGQPCAKCCVPHCSMNGRIFHHKNLATHGKPRGAGLKVNVFSRTHEANLQAFIKLFSGTDISLADAEERILQDAPLEVAKALPPLPKKKGRPRGSNFGRVGQKKKDALKANLQGKGKKEESPANGHAALEEEEDDEEEESESESGSEDDELDAADAAAADAAGVPRDKYCAACDGKHRAHTCKLTTGQRVRKKKKRQALNGGSGEAVMRVRRMKQAQRLNEDAKWIVGEEVDSLWDGEGSRRKRQKREHYDPVPEPRYGSGEYHQYAGAGGSSSNGVGLEPVKRGRGRPKGSTNKNKQHQQQPKPAPEPVEFEEEELGCFCDTQRHLPTNDIPFEGVWVQCDGCDRWCHGECAGVDKHMAEELESYECPLCERKRRAGLSNGNGNGGAAASTSSAAAVSAVSAPLLLLLLRSGPSPRRRRRRRRRS